MNLKEIAKAANVSPSTVSFVLNNTGQVSEETRKKVSALLKENGYTVSPYYRNKTTKHFCFIKFIDHGMLVQENTGYVSDMVDAIGKEVKRIGYSLETVIANRDNMAQILQLADKDPTDGILLLGTELIPEDAGYLQALKKPLVILDNPMDGQPYNCVSVNYEEAVRHAVKHLLDSGHREIGYLYSNRPSANCQNRFRAFRHAMGDEGLPLLRDRVFRVTPTLTKTYEDVTSLLKAGVTFPPALLATNDCMAIGAIKAFTEFGLSVPEDISVVGFDDIAFATIVEPELTTVRIPRADMGLCAIRLLSDRVNYPDSTPIKIQISTELIVRESICTR